MKYKLWHETIDEWPMIAFNSPKHSCGSIGMNIKMMTTHMHTPVTVMVSFLTNGHLWDK